MALARESVARVYAGEPTPHDLLARAVALERGARRAVPVGESPCRSSVGSARFWDDDLETARSDLELVDGRAAPSARAGVQLC